MKTNKTFRQLEAELETIMQRIEQAAYEDLDDLLKDHDAGMKLLDAMQTRLTQAGNTVKRVDTETVIH